MAEAPPTNTPSPSTDQQQHRPRHEDGEYISPITPAVEEEDKTLPEATNPSQPDVSQASQLPEANSSQPTVPQTPEPSNEHETPFSIFTHNEKRLIVLCAGISAFFSPISGQIYFPSIGAIAQDLGVSYSEINLTITVYLIIQGIAPAFIGSFSDTSGRRPAYLTCFILYTAANLGLALQSSYAALMVLRCLQAAGGSGTVALANAVIADLVSSQERGVYVSYASVPALAGPSIGPIIGGLLGQYLGWHSIFWFLVIFVGVTAVPVGLLMAETCRRVVDDGSVPPPKYSRCYLNTKVEKRLLTSGTPYSYARRAELSATRRLRIPNPLSSIKIVFTKEAGFILLYIGIVACSYYATVSLLPSQFGRIYNFNQIQIALCYIPLGGGSLLAGFTRGKIMDTRYKYHAKRLGVPIEKNRKADLSNFPIERVRLEVAMPTLALGTACMVGFGWMVQSRVNLAGPLIFLFVIGFCVSGSVNTVSVLLVDIFPGRAGAASAASNLVRCWLGAGATAGVVPMIDKVGVGWTTTFFALLSVVFSPILWYVVKNGPRWRRATKERKDRQEAERAAKADVGGEKGQM